MIHLYFVCMGNYYRSRLAEELAMHYAQQYGLEIAVDSGGLSSIPSPMHPGPIAKETLNYLAQKQIESKTKDRYPRPCNKKAIETADFVILTDDDEQRYLFLGRFPEYEDKLISWHARDKKYDPGLRTLELIDIKTEALIKSLL